MNTEQKQQDQRAQEEEQMKRGDQKQQQQGNQSQQATEVAKKGDPLPADRQRDRSPKQENL